MANLRCPCGKPITRREKKLNSGLCNTCLDRALRAVAKELGRKLKDEGK